MSKTSKRQNKDKQKRNALETGQPTSPSKYNIVKVTLGKPDVGIATKDSPGIVNKPAVTEQLANGSIPAKANGVLLIKTTSTNGVVANGTGMRPVGVSRAYDDDQAPAPDKRKKATSRLVAMKNRLRSSQKKKEEKKRWKSKSVDDEVPVDDFRPYVRNLQRSVTEGSMQHDPGCEYHHRARSLDRLEDRHHRMDGNLGGMGRNLYGMEGSMDSLASRTSSNSSTNSNGEGTRRRGIRGLLMKRSRTFEGTGTNLHEIPEDMENNADVHYQIYQRLVGIQAAEARRAPQHHRDQGQLLILSITNA